MNAAELKLKIFRQIDALEKNSLQEFYGILLNYMNGQKQLSDWDKLSNVQKQGIFDAIDEINADKGIPHEELIMKYRNKYSHG